MQNPTMPADIRKFFKPKSKPAVAKADEVLTVVCGFVILSRERLAYLTFSVVWQGTPKRPAHKSPRKVEPPVASTKPSSTPPAKKPKIMEPDQVFLHLVRGEVLWYG